MFKKKILKLLLLTITVSASFACNGYNMKIVKLEDCGGSDSVMSFDKDFSIELNKQCELVATGCLITKAFTTAVSQYKVVKDGLTTSEGTTDICTMVENAPPMVKEYLKLFDAPDSCPIQEGKLCGNERRVDLSKFKTMLSMARGYFVVDSTVEHDTGKSCFHIELEIKRG